MDHFGGAKTPLGKHLSDARQKLFQTGTRNRLIHTSRFAKQGKAIDVVDERSDDVFKILLSDGRRMRFAHDPSVRETREADEPLLIASPNTEFDEGRFTDLLLQTRFGQDRLQKKLLGLARDARTLEEEQGINALYLAAGFLRWFEDEKSEVMREAPLVLLPVSLRRNDRTSSYEVEIRGEDVATNEPLKYRLNDDFGIKLPDIPETEEWRPSTYFDAVAEAVGGKARWSIDREGIQLGFFSFAKLLMVKDLEPTNWPEGALAEHSILSGLLLDGFASERDEFVDVEHLDTLFAPADLIQVVDADASQTLVIETVRRGRNLVVQGPPGTGKSQTITNIIAAAAYDGKSVLFVAEKMAALNVVHDRLKNSGLRDICLELHSRSANKRLVAEELGRTLAIAGSTPSAVDAAELTNLRDRLNRVAEVMHKPIGDSGVTPYRAISTLIRLNEQGFAPSDLNVPGVAGWDTDQLDRALKAAATLAEMTDRAGPTTEHPFYAVRRLDLLPTDRQRLKPKLDTLLAALRDTGKAVAVVAHTLGVTEAPTTRTSTGMSSVIELVATLSQNAVPFAASIAQHGGTDRARALAEAGQRFEDIRSAYGPTFSPAALRAPIEHLRPMLTTGHSFLGRLGGPYRSASAELASLLRVPLPSAQKERLSLLDGLSEFQAATVKLTGLEAAGTELLGQLWRGDETDFAALSEATKWLGRLLQMAVSLSAEAAVGLRRHEPDQLRKLQGHVAAKTASAKSLAQEIVAALDVDLEQIFGVAKVDDVPFEVLGDRVELWSENLERLDEWAQLKTSDAALRSIAGDEIADATSLGQIAPQQVRSTIRYIHAEGLYRVFAKSEAWAVTLTAAEKAELGSNFRDREKSRRAAVAQLIRGQHIAQLPRGGMGAMGLVRGEIGKRRGHRPIRRLITDAGSAVQQIKPVFLMSPISVAQYLPPGTLEFDLLVIDEASQVRPEDALGAIARARQVVVVGDKRQLPPTSFFDRAVSDLPEEEPDEESDIPAPKVTSATELESILTLCEARGLSSRMLRWHYRSRHPSLIHISNEVFYGENGGLILFPSPSTTREIDGLTLTRVDGAYDRGGKRNNLKEAQAVAEAVAHHAAHHARRSLGVVTFSTAQRDAITERLASMRTSDADLDAFMREREDEEFFVKNIENVQGDERDVILISVGYGPRVAGTPLDSMAFGPVSTEGGERRLNVLFTRARYRTEVFVSFRSGDINLERSRSVGARVLKQFLDYAETGDSKPATQLDEDPDSDFEVSVAAEVRRLGYKVDHQIGSAGFKIDLAVRRPDQEGRYMLAIECDGATYHSAVWARERDRLRQEVLEGLGWRFHRVWSTDWFHRRAEEARRLEAALVAAAQDRTYEAEDLTPEHSEAAPPEETITRLPSSLNLPDYVAAKFAVPDGVEPHDVSVLVMASVAQRIVEAEGPIHREEVARRVAALFGKLKAGSRIVASVEQGLAYLGRTNSEFVEEGGFWTTKSIQRDVPLRNRSRAGLSLRRAAMLPPAEIAVAVRKVLVQNGSLSWDELPRAVALLFGFQRTGPDFRPAIVPVIEALVQSGVLVDGVAGLQLAN